MTTNELAAWKKDFIERTTALTLNTINHFMNLYAEDCEFSDPFHSLTGRKAIGQAYRSMFLNLHRPCFTDLVIAEVPQPTAASALSSESGAELSLAARWVFRFSLNPAKPIRAIPGTSWLQVDSSNGQIKRHEDHWDASLLFESFGGLSWAVRYLRQRVAAASHVTDTT
jgi:hypothetical protein